MKKEKKYVIWSWDVGDLDDWENEDGSPMTMEEASELNDDYLGDEKMNLEYAVTEGEIIAIGSIGLWDGTRDGYKLYGHRAGNILQAEFGGLCEWWGDGKDIRGSECHHDGHCSYLYRVLKGKDHDEQIENARKLMAGDLSPRRIGAFTSSLYPYVAKVYGWT